MDDKQKVFYPEVIEEQPLTFSNLSDNSSSVSTGNVLKQEEIKDQQINFNFSKEVISPKLNTLSNSILGDFKFASSGAISIGEYKSGVSGEIKISPAGIVAKNPSGDITLSIDGSTGQAAFKGEVTAGSIITGQVNVGNSNVKIDGANKRIIINDGTRDIILIGYQQGGF